jgi:phosphotransferase system enzyme I (PtsI)
LSFEHRELFLQQIRAVLRAAYHTDKQVRLLFPMITTWDELQQVHEFVAGARRQLVENLQPCGEVQVGMMVEVPAAAVMIERLLGATDFVSIGSNDLVQYLTAADRDNPRVSHLCQALSPAVLRVLDQVIKTCVDANKPVTLCGEMAGSVRAFMLLLGMGLRSFSMSPAFIPPIRDLAAHVTTAEAAAILAEVLTLQTSRDIHSVMDAHLQRIRPQLCPLLTA